MSPKIFAIVFSLFSVFIFFPSFSQWSKMNAPNEVGYVYDMILGENNRVFLSTSGGLYYSDDTGNHWSKVKESFNNVYSSPYLYKDRNNNIIAFDKGNYVVSKDNGNTWTDRFVDTNAIRSDILHCIGISNDTLFVGSRSGLSIHYGNEFELQKVPLFENVEVTSIAVEGEVVLVGTADQGLFLSQNSGKTWLARSSQLPSSIHVSQVKYHEGDIYLGTYSNGIFFSEDLGQTWKAVSTGIETRSIYDIHIKEDSIYAVTDSYSTIYASSLNNINWSLIEHDISSLYSPAKIISINGVLLVGGSKGVFRSVDRGNSWQLSIEGIRNAPITDLKLGLNGEIFALGHNLYRKLPDESTFKIIHWTEGGGIGKLLTDDTSIYLTNGNVSAFDLSTGEKKYDFNYGDNLFFSNDLLKYDNVFYLGTSMNGVRMYTPSNEWVAFNEGLPIDAVNALKLSSDTLFAATDSGLFKRKTTAESWQKVDLKEFEAPVLKIIVKDSLIFAYFNFGSIYSDDYGKTWREIEALANIYLNDIQYFNSTIYASGYRTAYFSSDLLNWTTITCPEDVFLESILYKEDTLFFGTLEDDIWKYHLKAPVIETIFNQFYVCPGSTINAKVSVSNLIFSEDNVFSLQLSDATGSFDNPMTIGTLLKNEIIEITGVIPQNLAPGSRYRLRVTSSNPEVSGTQSGEDIRVEERPEATISVSGTTLTASSGSVYKWFLDGQPLEETTQTITVNKAGKYAVEVTDLYCSGMSEEVELKVLAVEDFEDVGRIALFPNPNRGAITVSGISQVLTMRIVDMLGQVRLSKILRQYKEGVDLTALPKGLYLVIIESGNNTVVKRIERL